MTKHYDHAYTVAFAVESDDPDGATFGEWLAALKAYVVSDLDILRQAWEGDGPFDTFDTREG